jgi:CRISPR-associated protein Cmr5
VSAQTLSQRRARRALDCIEAHRAHKDGQKRYKNYVSYTESLPATILMNGLGQACATLLSKAAADLQNPHRLLYADLQSWLCGSDVAAPFHGKPELIEAIVGSKQKEYFAAQSEALAYLVWLKKFANAYLERGPNE